VPIGVIRVPIPKRESVSFAYGSFFQIAIGSGPEFAADAEESIDVVDGGFDDFDACVEVLDPFDGDVVNPVAGFFADDKQLGIEEPHIVLDMRDEHIHHLSGHGFETALRVGEAGEEHCLDHEVIGSRNELAFDAAHRVRSLHETGAGAYVVTFMGESMDHGGKGIQIRGKIDIHVAHDVRIAAGPGALECPAAAFLLEAEIADALEFTDKRFRNHGCAIDGGVVRDFYAPVISGHVFTEEGMQHGDADGKSFLFVVHGDGDEQFHERPNEMAQATPVN
jgi:hypothetical protein